MASESFKVCQSGPAKAQLKKWVGAIKEGHEAKRVWELFAYIADKLAHEANTWGEMYRAHPNVKMMKAIHGYVAVHYELDEARRLVYVRNYSLFVGASICRTLIRTRPKNNMSDHLPQPGEDWEKERDALRAEIERLRKENEELQLHKKAYLVMVRDLNPPRNSEITKADLEEAEKNGVTLRDFLDEMKKWD